jgi:hypothetical protein
MDTLSLRDTEEAYGGQTDFDVPPMVRFDERRMHVRAYNHWASLLGERAFPLIADLDPAAVADFAPQSVLLDFSAGLDNPLIAYLGTALVEECGVPSDIRHIRDVPSRTLLSRLTDHYLQIIANEAPIGFEAEFTNQRGADILYRGILMPFSSTGDTIDFIYGVINWKEVAGADLADSIAREVEAVLGNVASGPSPANVLPVPTWADGPALSAANDAGAGGAVQGSLADRLAHVRDCAAAALQTEGRSRAALYRAIGEAHDFALAAREAPGDYAELLADAGIVAHRRNPLTALVKLAFGAGYDKTRLAEIALVIGDALDRDLPAGALAARIEAQEGGLKEVVRRLRAARRPAPANRPEPRASLLARAPMALEPAQVDADGLAIIVARRHADGSVTLLGALPPGDRLNDQVMAKVARADG